MSVPDRSARAAVEELCINTIRTLSIDGVQKANSGHPGTPMALAPLAYVLWTEFLRHNPKNPQWFDRDRFVLSNGHASMLLYSMLHLTGYDLSLDDLENFRQLDSRTPGHPEVHHTAGVETTTGPLGQGLMNSVGMAMAEAHLAAVFNKPGHDIVDHHTYVFCGDGDLMEGASHEAASLAGHLGLHKLIWIYDDNHISIEGPTELAYSDDAAKRFEAYDWHVQNIGEKANDLEVVAAAIEAARAETERPSLIIVRTHIGYGSPNMQDTSEVHGAPLGADEVALTKKAYGWPENEHFLVPDEVREHMAAAIEGGAELENAWNTKFTAYRKEHPEDAAAFEAALKQELPGDWDADIPVFSPDDKPVATRAVGGKVLNAIAGRVPWLAGGSADLSPSTKTLIGSSDYFEKGRYENRNFAFGVREHVMCAAASGMYLHGGIRPYTATFFVFTDYARPAIRLAALMKLPVIYVMTHDSIGVGEDGPTHQPVEHMASLRCMPNMCVIRPADANETAAAWRAAILRRDGPTILVLTRQGLPILDRASLAPAEGLTKGAYILSREKGKQPDVVLIASGSEVQLALEAQRELAAKGTDARVVSMPSWELFRAQPPDYRDSVLPGDVKARLAVEAGSVAGWHEWVGADGDVIGMTTFGTSAPGKEAMDRFGFSVENVVARAAQLAAR
ncbi:MAG: transketolase [Planctomycetota bacterium]|jgi:transketolase